ncbi:MAG: sigma-70 family RNA polymerase sigma factor [Verrucomicrobiales bacterium]|nr:sigma-70 family RNA polymerase sigma factor [Verrucomicrobiales bacterium]
MTRSPETPPKTRAIDGDPWRQFAETQSEAAFNDVVGQHLDLVYSTAVRRCHGDEALAKDVAQIVFADLSRKARQLPRDIVLAGWLYRHTTFVASKAVRTELRRRERDQVAVDTHQRGEDVDWSQVAPILEDAMGELPHQDRDAIVLRYLNRQSLADVGSAFGISPDAARMRVDRAMDRLRALLARRGVTSTAAAIAMAIGHHAVFAAPAGLAATVIGSVALTGTTVGVSTGFIALMSTAKIQLGLATLVAISAATSAILTQRQNAALRTELEAVRAATTSRSPVEDGTAQPTAAELEALRQDRLRLMELRNEVGQLRDAQRRLAELHAENQALKTKTAQSARTSKEDQESRDFEAEMEKGLALARMTFTGAWMRAFYMYASENDDRFPETFADAAKHFQADEQNPAVSVLDPNRFEIVFKGSLKDLTNPSRTIVIREREPFTTTSKATGAKVQQRAYAFADGHSEIHAAPDGNFEAWEREHLWTPSATTGIQAGTQPLPSAR